MTRVLFLGGLGRSGTTLLERVVGELPDVVALGEVVHLWQRSLVENEPCGCGASFRDCPFWQRVGASAFGGWATVDPERVLALRDALDRTRFLPVLARRELPARVARDLAEYVSYYERIYAAAAEVSGATTVVDSSKHASLAYCLRHARSVDLRLVHCVRDSRAVAYSWTKVVPRPESTRDDDLMTRYPPRRSALLWNAHNAALVGLRRLGVPTLVLRYETFVAAPRAAVSAVAAFAGVGAERDPLEFLGDDYVDLSPGHTTSGNPMRFRTGRVPIRIDEAWRRGLPARQQRVVTALTLPLLRGYRYPVSATGAAR